MRDIVTLLQPIQDQLSKTSLRQLSRIISAMLAMTGRVTMLGMSRWAGEGVIDRIGFEAGGYGIYLRVDHGSFWTYYCHLSENSVRYPLNAAVYPHLILALVGSTGFSSGPHLHWGARRKSYSRSDPWRGYFDPLKLVK